MVIMVPIHGDNRTRRKGDFPGNGDIVLFPVGNVGIGREVPLMIQQEAEFDCPLGPSELGPVNLSQALGLSHLVEHDGKNDPELNPLP